MSCHDIKIVDKDFSEALLSLGKIEHAFTSMSDRSNQYATIVGHDQLASSLEKFENSWKKKRADLTSSIQSYRKDLEGVRDAFTAWDNGVGKGLSNEQQPSQKADTGSQQQPQTSSTQSSTPHSGEPRQPLSAGDTPTNSTESAGTRATPESSTNRGTSGPLTPSFSASAQTEPTDSFQSGSPLSSPLNESGHPEVEQMRQLLGPAVDIGLAASPDGSLTMRIGSLTGISLAAISSVLSHRKTSPPTIDTLGSDTRQGDSSNDLRQALAEISNNDIPTSLHSDRESTLASLQGIDEQPPKAPLTTSTPPDMTSGSSAPPLPLDHRPSEVDTSASPISPTPPAPQAGESTPPSLTPPQPSPSPSTSATSSSTSAGHKAEPSSSSSTPLMSGMGMAAGLGTGSAIQSANDDKRNEEARRLRDQLQSLKEKN